MDMMSLSSKVVDILAPFLPYLFRAGKEAASEAAKKFGADAWKSAKTLWSKLRQKINEKPDALDAAQKVANRPEDPRVRAVLASQIEGILHDNPTLMNNLITIIGDANVTYGSNNVINVIKMNK